MADLQGLYSEQDEPSRSFEILPKGWVEAMIVVSEKKVKDAEHERVSLTYQILDQRPEYKGRKMWHGLNFKNPNAQAVQISRGQFSSIRKAVGVVAPKDTTELHNLPHMILIGQRTNKQSGELENVINDWKPKATVATSNAPVISQAQTVPTPVPVGGGAAPWKR